VFDMNNGTRYNSYGSCNKNANLSADCGSNTALYLTVRPWSSLLIVLRFRTGNNLTSRDPLTVTVERSNLNSSELSLGLSWTLIYNGSTGLDTHPDRDIFVTLILYLTTQFGTKATDF
jgi:hypothetical protein